VDRHRQVLVNRGVFSDFDQFEESTQGWHLDWRQLDRGCLDVSLTQVATGSALVSHAAFSRAFEQHGVSPRGARTFAVVEAGVRGTRWCGQPMLDEHVTVFPRTGEFEALSKPGFTIHTLALSEELLVRTCQTLETPRVDRLLVDGSGHVWPSDPEAVGALRFALQRVRDAAAPGVGRLAGLVDEIESEVPVRLVRALASGQDDGRPPSFGTRQLALDRARPFIEAHRDRPITVAELCEATRLSRRTLEYAFGEQLGVSPRAYLAALRLDGVRRELVPSDPPVTIADVANRWGFWHMGQFAADYRRQFGELPSETLRRRGRYGHLDAAPRVQDAPALPHVLEGHLHSVRR